MKFAKVRYSCLGCKATLAPGDTTLCKHCRNKVSANLTFYAILSNVRELYIDAACCLMFTVP